MTDTIWVLVVWFGFGTGWNKFHPEVGGAVTIAEARYETKAICEAAKASVLKNNKHMEAFRVASAECMAVPLATK